MFNAGKISLCCSCGITSLTSDRIYIIYPTSMDYIFDDLGGPSVLSTGPKFLYVQILWIFILQILRYFFFTNGWYTCSFISYKRAHSWHHLLLPSPHKLSGHLNQLGIMEKAAILFLVSVQCPVALPKSLSINCQPKMCTSGVFKTT